MVQKQPACAFSCPQVPDLRRGKGGNTLERREEVPRDIGQAIERKLELEEPKVWIRMRRKNCQGEWESYLLETVYGK